MLGILSRIFARKVAQSTTEPPARPIMLVPLGLSPGSVWSVPDLDVELALVEGAILLPPTGNLIVDRVGHAVLFGLDVWHVRFADETCLLQIVTAAGNMHDIQQLRLFTLHATVTPTTHEDWEFWLGRAERDEQGRARRDGTGAVILEESGLIGGPTFQIDGPPAIAYNRQWPTPGDRAVRFEETMENAQGQREIMVHEAMEYARRLCADDGSSTEYLLATAHGVRGQVRVYVGIDLDATTQRVISLR